MNFKKINRYIYGSKKLILYIDNKANYDAEKKYFLTKGNVRLLKKGLITEEFYFSIHDKLFKDNPIEPYKWKQEELEYRVNLFIENRNKLCSKTWKDLDTKEDLENYLKLYRILYKKEITKPLIDDLTNLWLHLKTESDRLLKISEDVENFSDCYESSKPYILKNKNLIKKIKSHSNKRRSLLDFIDPLEKSFLSYSNINNSDDDEEEILRKHARKIKLAETEFAIRVNYDDLLSRQYEVTLLLGHIKKVNSIDTWTYKLFYIYIFLRLKKPILFIYFYYILLLIPFIFSIINIFIELY